MSQTSLFSELRLPNGSSLPNRIAKAAMEENMADADHAPSGQLIQLYDRWARGGAGLLITGNVMVDGRAMTGPGGVVLQDGQHADRFRAWARSAKQAGAQVWMQINHPGRQMPAALRQDTIAPSAVAMQLGSFSSQFKPPRPMTEQDIKAVAQRFVQTAQLAERLGFDGVQVHAAHGYLLSQFLSPLTNQRQDAYGGSLENRSRLLIEIVRGIRASVGPTFAVSVKINSADFQRGGFGIADAKAVVELLNAEGLDLIELSGGSYEAPAMHGDARDGRTLAREAYFLEFAKDIANTAAMPVMVTGGIRRLPVANDVVEGGIHVVGMATALAIDPSLPNAWKQGQPAEAHLRPITWRNKVLASVGYMAMVKHQLRRLSLGKQTNPRVAPALALFEQQADTLIKNRRYRRWASGLGA